jgi:hypothetical protein
MDVQASISHLPVLYQGPALLFMGSMPYAPLLYPEVNVDCVEIWKGRLSTANAMAKYFVSLTAPIIKKGTLIDLFV